MIRALSFLVGMNLISISISNEPVAYTLIDPISTERIGCWHGQFDGFDTMVGYSHLGHLFLRASADDAYIVVHPFQAAAKSYGHFASIADFELQVLREPGFAAHVLEPDHVALIHARLGALAKDEIYAPVPYPFVGGSGEPSTYEKADLWVFTDIVAQLHGLCD